MLMWTRIDGTLEEPPRCIEPSDYCYFAREYIAGRGYQASEANSLISNFKKSPSCRGTPQWYHKEKAANQFAAELARLIGEHDLAVVPIPTSKPASDPEYDPRFDMLLTRLRAHRPNVHIERPIVRSASREACHRGGSRRIGDQLLTLSWVGFQRVPGTVLLVDDVVTTGTSFKACKGLIVQHHPTTQVGGAFWTRTVHLDDA